MLGMGDKLTDDDKNCIDMELLFEEIKKHMGIYQEMRNLLFSSE